MIGRDRDSDDGLAGEGASEAGSDAGRGEPGTTQARRPRSVLEVLPRLTLLEAIASSEARKPRSVTKRAAVVVAVPSLQWVAPIASAAREFGPWNVIVKPMKPRAKRADDTSETTVAIAQGRRVLGVSHDPARFLPPSLVAGADLRLDVQVPTNDTLARIVSAVTFRRPRGMPENLAVGLDFDDLVSSIRLGSSAADCVLRLVGARAAKSVVDGSVADAPPLEDLHGYGKAMDWCLELVSDLQAWKRGDAPFPVNARVVLSGPPGTGKTTLVRALAKSAQLPLIATSVGAWFANSPGNLDSVIKQIAEVWDAARAVSPSIVFLDELDALPNRATMSSHGRDWWLPVVTFILTSLDSVVSGVTNRLIVIGATNHASDIDAALIRPGRLEKFIHVGPPDNPADRVGILRTHLRGLLADVDLTPLAHLTGGMSGADIMAVVRNAGRRARVAGRPLVVGDLFSELDPPETRPSRDVERCAMHEAGHAVAACALGFAVDTVTIIPRGDRGGEASYRDVKPSFPTRADMERFVVLTLAGAATEEVLTGSRSSSMGGSERSDIGQATAVVASMHVSFGLADALSYRVSPGNAGRLVAADAELRGIVEADLARLYARAKDLVREHRSAIERVAEALLETRILTGEQVEALLRDLTRIPPATPARSELRGTARPYGSSDARDREGHVRPDTPSAGPGAIRGTVMSQPFTRDGGNGTQQDVVSAVLPSAETATRATIVRRPGARGRSQPQSPSTAFGVGPANGPQGRRCRKRRPVAGKA